MRCKLLTLKRHHVHDVAVCMVVTRRVEAALRQALSAAFSSSAVRPVIGPPAVRDQSNVSRPISSNVFNPDEGW
jgi:hypothetical protein